MKKYLLIPLLLLIVAFAFATEYMIGTGTSTQNYVPFDGLWDYSWSKTIYTKAELNAAGLNSEGNIDAISYYVGNTPSNYQMLDQRVYIRHTTLSTYGTATDETGTGYPNNTVFTYVFQGNLTLNGGGWFDIVFSTPFYWNNTDNLEILWENWDGDYVSGYPTFCYTTATNTCVYKYQDNSFPAIAGTQYSSRPNIKFSIIDSAPNPANLVSPLNGATNILLSQTLNWASGGGFPTGYKLSFGTVSPFTTIINQSDLGAVTTYDPDLAISTEYWWKITPYNEYGEASDCPTWTFTTASPPLTGTKTIGSGGNYATFTDAVNALNGCGVGSGGVTFNVYAGSVFEENIPIITTTGTASNPIIFQKSGTGENPVIKPTTATAGIQILGGDYITFDGIDVTRPTGSTSYYGYSIKAASATDGAKYNTIKNCKIILDRTNSSCYGIYQYYSVTPTAAGGTNSNNTYQNIVIENAYRGF
ncbi:MAG: hypothetical protein M0P45_07880, partial [Candidatus Cloacimonas sp.]|nr:hypothetical protein [Candidatus Cloacimonas sp.]